MAIIDRLLRQIERVGVPYEVLPHGEAFTARDVAHDTHISSRVLAKPVVVREESGQYSMAVVNAAETVDLAAVRRGPPGTRVRLADELELARLFPDCELGAMPPVGHLYGIPTYIDEEFRRHPEICFQAGNHHEVVRMRFVDFEKVAGPFAGVFSLHREPAPLWS